MPEPEFQPCPRCRARWALVESSTAQDTQGLPLASTSTEGGGSSGSSSSAGAGSASATAPFPAVILDPVHGRFSPCDVQRVARDPALSAQYVWLSALGKVYRVPKEWAERVHPGGSRSILSHAGTDSSQDFEYHSEKARKVWAKFEEGTLVPCTPSPFSCSIT